MICGLAEERSCAIHCDVDLIRTGCPVSRRWQTACGRNGSIGISRRAQPSMTCSMTPRQRRRSAPTWMRGLKLARKHRLPQALADFIPEPSRNPAHG